MADDLRERFDEVLREYGPGSRQVNGILDGHRGDELFLRYALGKVELHEQAMSGSVVTAPRRDRVGRTYGDLLASLDERLGRDGYR